QPRRRRAVRVDGAAGIVVPQSPVEGASAAGSCRRSGIQKLAAEAAPTVHPYFGCFFGRCQPSTVTCRARATVSSPAGASMPITEPAPIVAPLPIVTGATSEALEPMKALSSMVVV